MELIDACHRAAGLQPRPRTPRMQPPGLTAGQLKHTKSAYLDAKTALRRRFAPVGWLVPMRASVGLAIASGPPPRKGLGTPVGAVGPYRM